MCLSSGRMGSPGILAGVDSSFGDCQSVTYPLYLKGFGNGIYFLLCPCSYVPFTSPPLWVLCPYIVSVLYEHHYHSWLFGIVIYAVDCISRESVKLLTRLAIFHFCTVSRLILGPAKSPALWLPSLYLQSISSEVHLASYTIGSASFPGGKAAGAWH